MHSRIGHAPTKSANRYLQQLCKHWNHKFPVTFDEHKGEIIFSEKSAGTVPATATAVLLTAHDDRIEIEITCPDSELHERMQGVVEKHLDRFAFREAPLTYVWGDAG